MRLLIICLFLMYATEALANETGTIYRAKRGPDSYFKSINYRKSLLVSYAELWSDHFNLPSHIIKGQIEQESLWDNNALSHKGAQGLMQILPSTARCRGYMCLKMSKEESLYNPYTNIYYGCKYMSMLMKMFDNNIRYSLMAYYGGPYRMQQILNNEIDSQALIDEIEEYAENVLDRSVAYLEIDQMQEKLIETASK